MFAAVSGHPVQARLDSGSNQQTLLGRLPKRKFAGGKMKPVTRTRMPKFGIGLAFALLACGGAFAQDVSYNAMPVVDFSKYHTYKWVTIQGASYPNQILDTQIKNSIALTGCYCQK
jgi:hypothetical protein